METNNPPVQPVNTQPTPPRRNWFDAMHIITYVVVLVGLGLIGWQIYAYVNTPKETTNTQTTQTPDVTANWKTYTNTQYGFEFKYPEETMTVKETKDQEGLVALWNKETLQNLGTVDTSPDIFIDFQSQKNPNITQDWLDSSQGYTLFKLQSKKESLGGKEAFIANGQEIMAGSVIYLFPSATGTFIVEVKKTPESNQVLSTFKFTDSVSTADWKTYSSAEYNFEIKYPANWAASGTGVNSEYHVSFAPNSGNGGEFTIVPGGAQLSKLNLSGEPKKSSINLLDAAAFKTTWDLPTSKTTYIQFIDPIRYWQPCFEDLKDCNYLLIVNQGDATEAITSTMLSSLKFNIDYKPSDYVLFRSTKCKTDYDLVYPKRYKVTEDIDCNHIIKLEDGTAAFDFYSVTGDRYNAIDSMKKKMSNVKENVVTIRGTGPAGGTRLDGKFIQSVGIESTHSNIDGSSVIFSIGDKTYIFNAYGSAAKSTEFQTMLELL